MRAPAYQQSLFLGAHSRLNRRIHDGVGRILVPPSYLRDPCPTSIAVGSFSYADRWNFPPQPWATPLARHSADRSGNIKLATLGLLLITGRSLGDFRSRQLPCRLLHGVCSPPWNPTGQAPGTTRSCSCPLSSSPCWMPSCVYATAWFHRNSGAFGCAVADSASRAGGRDAA